MARKVSLDDVIERVADSEDSGSDWEVLEGDRVEGFQTLRTSESSILLQGVFQEEMHLLLLP